jgi:hypothetical protein
MVEAFVAGTGRLGQDKEENGRNSLFSPNLAENCPKIYVLRLNAASVRFF